MDNMHHDVNLLGSHLRDNTLHVSHVSADDVGVITVSLRTAVEYNVFVLGVSSDIV